VHVIGGRDVVFVVAVQKWVAVRGQSARGFVRRVLGKAVRFGSASARLVGPCLVACRRCAFLNKWLAVAGVVVIAVVEANHLVVTGAVQGLFAFIRARNSFK
jgi:hypothetical protein